MPNDSSNYNFVIYPLQAGYCKLPRFRVKLNNADLKTANTSAVPLHNETTVLNENEASVELNDSFDLTNLDLIVQSMLPTQIFIMPQTSNFASST